MKKKLKDGLHYKLLKNNNRGHKSYKFIGKKECCHFIEKRAFMTISRACDGSFLVIHSIMVLYRRDYLGTTPPIFMNFLS